MLKFTKFKYILKMTLSYKERKQGPQHVREKIIIKYHERRIDFNLDLRGKMEMDVLISVITT